jgi:hypothetical protein
MGGGIVQTPTIYFSSEAYPPSNIFPNSNRPSHPHQVNGTPHFSFLGKLKGLSYTSEVPLEIKGFK